ncbi:hypothetical protein [Streptococcus dysgalactiae]|uniref:hypothetical protein n=1 Tax=Streptococcus dysgalactiae TaxID=1334 RepID=UPI001D175F82|nr:hypothetical protein [Streptococcus dysgalactiae]
MVKTVSIHSYEPSPNVVARTYDADIFIYHSNILESGLADLAPQLRKMEENVSAKLAKTLAKSSGISVRQLSPLEIAPDNQKSYLDNLEMNLAVLYDVLEKEK